MKKTSAYSTTSHNAMPGRVSGSALQDTPASCVRLRWDHILNEEFRWQKYATQTKQQEKNPESDG